ncbi:MAG: ABC transporter permease [Bifidobacteriaceae bacterium]|jgi:putative ABC transport system permease protein|nr:ABC transporter permease [Bifidobacteriaceae bacterium]
MKRDDARRTLRRRHHLSVGDTLTTATLGPRTRMVRAFLSALGIAIGIATLVAMWGIPASQEAQMLADLDAQGANLVTVYPGTDQTDQSPIPIPQTAPAMISRIRPVRHVLTVKDLPDVSIYRTDKVPANQTGGITAAVAEGELLQTLNVELAGGRWFDEASVTLPTAVLADAAARRLRAGVGSAVWADNQWWAVIGVLEPLTLQQQLDSTVFLAAQPAMKLHPEPDISAIYIASAPRKSASVRGVVAQTANPSNPRGVQVSQLSDYYISQEMFAEFFLILSLGMGGVALLVGGIGIANTMVVAVMERRGEIGLRRAMGARTGQITLQFVLEACVIGLGGGLIGVGLGLYIVFCYTAVFNVIFAIPIWILAAGPALAVIIGALAGLYPSLKAARQSPTDALRTV